jgi:hypothetical protein
MQTVGYYPKKGHKSALMLFKNNNLISPNYWAGLPMSEEAFQQAAKYKYTHFQGSHQHDDTVIIPIQSPFILLFSC